MGTDMTMSVPVNLYVDYSLLSIETDIRAFHAPNALTIIYMFKHLGHENI